MAASATPVLSVRDVKKHFGARRGVRRHGGLVYAVDGVSFDIHEGETLGLVGESGCGKSTLARMLTGLSRPTAGEIAVQGTNIYGRSTRRSGPGGSQMVFQDPAGSLDPRRRIADSVGEPLLGRGVSRRQRDERVSELLGLVGLDTTLGSRYPHQLSGGQQQRACIARALISDPALLVFDEALSSLDVSLQAQIVDLLLSLQGQLQGGYVFITHDLATAVEVSTRIAIMYLGEIVELVAVDTFRENTLHPYSQALIGAVLPPDPVEHSRRKLPLLDGEIPSAADPPSGCRFHTRCPYAQERCTAERPALTLHGPDHWAACHFAGNLPPAAPAATTRTAPTAAAQ